MQTGKAGGIPIQAKQQQAGSGGRTELWGVEAGRGKQEEDSA